MVAYASTSYKRIVDRSVYELTADTSPEGLARGEYIVNALGGCVDCHNNPDAGFLAGSAEEVELGIIKGSITFSNLTPDPDTGLGSWTDGEIARAIREGVSRDGTSLFLMPSFNYHVMSDADVAAVVGYLRSLESVNNPLPKTDANLPGKVMVTMGVFGPSPLGEPITSPQTTPALGDAKYGEYLVTLAGCRDCHGFDYAGGKRPDAAPGDPPAPNLTSGGDFGTWNADDFVTAMKNGINPDGEVLDPTKMPWPVYGNIKDEDLRAMFGYLQSVEALPDNY
jgi:mono/diheme cytochrome c family protein